MKLIKAHELKISDFHDTPHSKVMKLIKAHERLLQQTIGRHIQNPVDAEDVYQETLLKILEHFQIGKPVKTPKAWMVRIAQNECVNFHRQAERDTNKEINR